MPGQIVGIDSLISILLTFWMLPFCPYRALITQKEHKHFPALS